MNGGYMMIDFKGFDVTKPDSMTIPDVRNKVLAAVTYGKLILCYNFKKRGALISAVPNYADSNGNLIFSDFALNISEENAVTVGKSAISTVANMSAKNMSPSAGKTVGAAGNVVDNEDISLPAGRYIISFKSSTDNVGLSFKLGSGSPIIGNMKPTNGYYSSSFVAESAATKYTIYANAACTISELMIRPFEISDPTFVTYGPTNAELDARVTALEDA